MDNNKINNYLDIFKSSNCPSFDQLVAYSKKTLSKAENHHIEMHLIDCDFCSEALDGIENIKDIEKAKELIERINFKIRSRINSSGGGLTKFIKKQYLPIAATFLGLILIIFMFKIFDNKNSTFEQYFEPYPKLIPITRANGQTSTFVKAMQAYENKNLSEAENLLKEIRESEEHYDAATFYLGIIAVSHSEYIRARYLFHCLIDQQNLTFKLHAKWYLALIDLRMKKYSRARKILLEFVNSESIYKMESQRLLKIIEKY